ncbi:hypothetical protein CBR_g30576 [Chara braunii]|uniref:Uncharacterized protein n=1 Tax=Chara braunii TaxID=69332 RepID=A0A388LD30_CHABU|nr:hypothetical protein CBR_g30576 [Chara braunii]|eukprot:GBG80209.1 hypothetical protein CBR_g30576 [Chara braunii]
MRDGGWKVRQQQKQAHSSSPPSFPVDVTRHHSSNGQTTGEMMLLEDDVSSSGGEDYGVGAAEEDKQSWHVHAQEQGRGRIWLQPDYVAAIESSAMATTTRSGGDENGRRHGCGDMTDRVGRRGRREGRERGDPLGGLCENKEGVGRSQSQRRLNAVERARQREREREQNAVKMMSTQCTPDAAGRRKYRTMDYKPYTQADYKRQQAAGYVLLGKLGPDVDTEEHQSKKERIQKMKEFGRIARHANIIKMLHTEKPQKAKDKENKAVSAREKVVVPCTPSFP